MLNIELIQSMKVHFRGGETKHAIAYYGADNVYHITQSDRGSYYTLRVSYPDDSVLTYPCSSLSVAFANIEALERGEAI